jgi:hypothetical protein
MLLVDPEADVVVVVLTNTHLRIDRLAWYPRLLALTSAAWEALG